MAATNSPAKRKAGNPYMSDDSAKLDSSINPVISTLRSWDCVDFHHPEQVAKRLDDYFALCRVNDVKPGVAGLSMSLGINRKRLHEIMHGTAYKDFYGSNSKYKDIPKATRDIIQKAYDSLEVLWEYSMQSGKINPPCGIFLGKNHFGYQDVIDHNVTAQPAPEAIPAAQLQRQLESLPDDD